MHALVFLSLGKSNHLERKSNDVNISSSHSPKLFAKKKKNPLSRGTSSPEFNSPDFNKGKEKGLSSIFQKKKKSSGYLNLTVYTEENQEDRVSPTIEPTTKPVPKPLFKPRKSFGSNSGVSRPPRVLGDDMEDKKSQPNSTSPKEVATEQNSSLPKHQSDGSGAKKRPPPPRPQPFAKTHPTQAAKLGALMKAQKSVDENEEKTVSRERSGSKRDEIFNLSTKSKDSSSMEDLLKNLQDFEDAEIDDKSSFSDNQTVEYETCERPKTPPKHVETIKISDYKSDSDNQSNASDDDDGDDDDEDEELDAIGEEKELQQKEDNEITGSNDGVRQTEDWNPREWTPSPEPPVRPSHKLPSWSFEVASTSHKEDFHSKVNSVGNHPNSEKTKPVPSPKLMSRPKRSVSGSPRVTPSGSPRTTPSVSPRTTPSGSPKLPRKPPVISQKPVAPPRSKKKASNGSIGKDCAGKRTPLRAPPPPPAYKQSVTPTSRSELDMQGSKVPSSSNFPAFQQR